MPLLGLRQDLYLAMLSPVWVWLSVLDMFLYEGMVLVTFRKAKSKFFLLKSFYN
jgi:hypothetical protein